MNKFSSFSHKHIQKPHYMYMYNVHVHVYVVMSASVKHVAPPLIPLLCLVLCTINV